VVSVSARLSPVGRRQGASEMLVSTKSRYFAAYRSGGCFLGATRRKILARKWMRYS
jgi:hypothetical protein